MTLKPIKGAIIVISNRLVELLSALTGFKSKAYTGKKPMAFAVFPCFIVLRNMEHPMTPYWITHEKIHFRQSIETLGLIVIIALFEDLYNRFIKKKSFLEAYKMRSMEQEAYLNQHNANYLSERPLFATFKYFFNKTKFHSDEQYHLMIDKK